MTELIKTTKWATCKFFRLGWPFGKNSNPVKRYYTRRKKVKEFKFPKIQTKKGGE